MATDAATLTPAPHSQNGPTMTYRVIRAAARVAFLSASAAAFLAVSWLVWMCAAGVHTGGF